jgi:uncharacterized protein YkwD
MGNMKKIVTRFSFFCLILTLLGSAQPVSADSGVIGSPPAIPDPAIPSLQYSGCACQNVATFNSGFEQQVIDLVNQERTSRGLNPLKRSEGLTIAARYQAADMSQDNYFSHDTFDRQDGNLVKKCGPWERIANYYSGANGENAAAGYSTPQAVMNGWMNSSGHRANILNPSTVTIGVGFYQGSGDYHSYWVQDFGTKIDTTSAPTSGFLPENLAFMYSIPDQKLYPSYQDFTMTNVSSSDPLSWQVSKNGSFFAVTPGSGTTSTQIRVTPENFDSYQADTYQGSVTIDVTDPSLTAWSPHTTQINLTVVNSQVHQVFLPGILIQANSQQTVCVQN